jgi:hypothetical protein
MERETDEKEDPLCIFLPAFGHFVVFVLCHVLVHKEERPRAISEFRLWFLILPPLI